MWNNKGKKYLILKLQKFYLIRRRKHCSGVTLVHSSTQTIFSLQSWRFCGPLLWTLIFSSFHRFSTGLKAGDWFCHSSSFIFFLWVVEFSLVEFTWLCGIISLLKFPPLFHLHHPGRWRQVFIKNVLVHLSIHPSFNYIKSASTFCWKTAPCHDFKYISSCCLWDNCSC